MKKKTIIFMLAILLITAFSIHPAFCADKERVDVLMYLIDKNINDQVTGDSLDNRLRDWKDNVENVSGNLDELLKEVSELKSKGEEINLPRISGIMPLLREKRKNFKVIVEYRKILEHFMKGLKDRKYSSKQSFLDEFDSELDKMSSYIDDREPLVVLDSFDISSRMIQLRETLGNSDSSKSLKLVKKEWMDSRYVFKEYRKEVNDLEKLRIQYKKIYQYSTGESGKPGYLDFGKRKESHSSGKSKGPITFTPFWGDSPFAWRQLKVGDTIYPRMNNVYGGSGIFNYLWTMDGNIISRNNGASYRFRQPGMHYLVAKVNDSQGRSQWKSYVYHVRGGSGDNLHYNLDISDLYPEPGETVSFKVRDVYGGTPPYTIRWEMDDRYIGSGYYAQYRFSGNRNYKLRVRVRDQYGEEREMTRDFNMGSSGNLSFNLWASDTTPRLGETVRFEFRDVHGGSEPYIYKWNSNTGSSGTSRNFSYNFRSSGLHRIKAMVYDRYKRKATRYFTYRIGGSQQPLRVSMNYTTDKPNIGQTINLRARNAGGGYPPYNYQWYVDGTKIGDGSDVRNTWYRNGSSRVTLKISDSRGSSSTIHHTFHVGSGGSSGISFSEWFSNTSPNLGDTISFSARNLKGGTPPYTYRWEVNGRQVGSSSGTQHRFVQPGNYNVRVVVKDAAGRTASRTRTIRVSGSTQALRASFNWSNNSPKHGDTVTFRITNVHGGNPPYSYTHKIDGRVISNSPNATYRFNDNRTYRYQAEVKDSSGKVKRQTKNFNITGSSTPLRASFSWSNNNPKQGDTVTFRITNVNGGNSPYTYTHKIDGRVISNGPNATYRFNQKKAYRYQAEVRDSTGKVKRHTRNFNIVASTFLPSKGKYTWIKDSLKACNPLTFYADNLFGEQAYCKVKLPVNDNRVVTGKRVHYAFGDNLKTEVIDAQGFRKITSQESSATPLDNQADDIEFSMYISNTNPKVGQTVRFKANNIHGGQSPYRVVWTLSNAGQISTSTTAVWKFKKRGLRAVSCTVTDSRGVSKRINRNLRVR